MIPSFDPTAAQVIFVLLFVSLVVGLIIGVVTYSVTRSGGRSLAVAIGTVSILLAFIGTRMAWDGALSPRARQRARVAADRDKALDVMGLASQSDEIDSSSCGEGRTAASSIVGASTSWSKSERDAALRAAHRWLLEEGREASLTATAVNGRHGRRSIEISVKDSYGSPYVLIQVEEGCSG